MTIDARRGSPPVAGLTVMSMVILSVVFRFFIFNVSQQALRI